MKILERIFKVLNILINIIFAFFGGVYGFAKLIDNYSSERDVYGIIIFVLAFALVNFADGFIRGNLRKF